MSKMSNLQIMLEETKGEICDNYCKYPMEYQLEFEDSEMAHDMMLEEQCAECPLNRL